MFFFVWNEESAVAAWGLTNFSCKMTPTLHNVTYKLQSDQCSYIYTGTCCSFKNVGKQCFLGVPIKQDLFHATQIISFRELLWLNILE